MFCFCFTSCLLLYLIQISCQTCNCLFYKEVWFLCFWEVSNFLTLLSNFLTLSWWNSFQPMVTTFFQKAYYLFLKSIRAFGKELAISNNWGLCLNGVLTLFKRCYITVLTVQNILPALCIILKRNLYYDSSFPSSLYRHMRQWGLDKVRERTKWNRGNWSGMAVFVPSAR